jgi:hypothetical protein
MRTENTVRNCRVRMRVVCPQLWDPLMETSDPAVRHCHVCAEDVHLCATDAQTLAGPFPIRANGPLW